MPESKTRRLLKILMPSRKAEPARKQRPRHAFPRELWLEEYLEEGAKQSDPCAPEDKVSLN
jgi:hypothetical protein